MSSGVPVLAAALVGVLGIAAAVELTDRGPVDRGRVADTGVVSATSFGPATTLVASAAPTSTAPGSTAVTTTTVPVVLPAGIAADGQCPDVARAAVVDRASQQTWLCADGEPVEVMPITSAWTMPDPGDYPVYAKDLNASSTFGGGFSRMTHFVAFAYGKNTGARVAFHSVPTTTDGTYVQPLESVGDLDRRGESSGCIRVLPDDAVEIWDWLGVGDTVRVIS